MSHQRFLQFRRCHMAFVVASLLFSIASLACAQTEPDLRSEIETLKQGQAQIRKDLDDIKKILQPRRPPAANVKDVVFDLGENPVRGEQSAKLTLVEFSDYQ